MGQGFGREFCCAQRRGQAAPSPSSSQTEPSFADPSQALLQGQPDADASPATSAPSASTAASAGDVVKSDCGKAAKSDDNTNGHEGSLCIGDSCISPEALLGRASVTSDTNTTNNAAAVASLPQAEEEGAVPAPADSMDRSPPVDPEVDSELLEAGPTAMIRSDGGEQGAAQPKGQGKGKSKMPPPPKASAAPKPKAAAPRPKPAASAGAGMSALLNKVEAVGKKKDLEEAKEIEDIDMSTIDPSAASEKVVCTRCAKEVIKEHLESHMTAHSSEILPWLFLGGKRNLENDKEITVRTNITHVLNLAQEVNLKEDIRKIATEYNDQRGLPFVYKKFSFGDTPDQNILPELEGALQFIHDARISNEQHNVLVNCVQGISRSASVVLAYLMKYERLSLREAYDLVRARRTVADPRKEFLDQLAQFECQLFGLNEPTFTGAAAFEGRTLLNVDDPLPKQDQPHQEGPEVPEPKPTALQAEGVGAGDAFEDISNEPARHAAGSHESVSDWYKDENPTDSPTKIKTTSEWYLDGKPPPSAQTAETEVHALTFTDAADA